MSKTVDIKSSVTVLFWYHVIYYSLKKFQKYFYSMIPNLLFLSAFKFGSLWVTPTIRERSYVIRRSINRGTKWFTSFKHLAQLFNSIHTIYTVGYVLYSLSSHFTTCTRAWLLIRFIVRFLTQRYQFCCGFNFWKEKYHMLYYLSLNSLKTLWRTLANASIRVYIYFDVF